MELSQILHDYFAAGGHSFIITGNPGSSLQGHWSHFSGLSFVIQSTSDQLHRLHSGAGMGKSLFHYFLTWQLARSGETFKICLPNLSGTGGMPSQWSSLALQECPRVHCWLSTQNWTTRRHGEFSGFTHTVRRCLVRSRAASSFEIWALGICVLQVLGRWEAVSRGS